MTSLHSTHKNKGFRPQNPENDENDENGRCHSGKTRVYQKRGFHNPDLSRMSLGHNSSDQSKADNKLGVAVAGVLYIYIYFFFFFWPELLREPRQW